ncbi:uncharacterized protein METZ01_LOCUS474133 [marine metagenome]|uniref:Uncharacterized protein n=1 Tax=marine metagenome TaxID=408172 RepID=A0A383BN40_9ZZZZ
MAIRLFYCELITLNDMGESMKVAHRITLLF